MTNPLLADWSTPFQIAPFAEIADSDFAPALDEALATHTAEIEAIAQDLSPASFDSVIGALEAAGGALDRVL